MFLRDRLMSLFISPPDTTGVTQLLNQLIKIIYQQYIITKKEMFTPFNTINREAFMIILANIWPTWAAPEPWATKESLVNAARRVGITSTALSVEFMQQDKFERAEACIDEANSENLCSSSTLVSPIVSPDKREGQQNTGRPNMNRECL